MEDNFDQSMAVTSMKISFSIPFFTYQMYISCHVFDTLHDKVISNLYIPN